MYVKDFDESMNFYTKTMGFREVFSFKDKEANQLLCIFRSIATRSWNWRRPARIAP